MVPIKTSVEIFPKDCITKGVFISKETSAVNQLHLLSNKFPSPIYNT